MLRYFGENPTAPCGKCDVCRSRKAKAPGPAQIQSLRAALLTLAARPAGCTIDEAVQTIKSTTPITSDKIITQLRHLADSGEILLDEMKFYSPKK